MPLIPLITTKNVKVKNPETGLDEARQEMQVTYYKSNNNPYDPCKTCKVKKLEDKEYKMNLRRNGSAYCEECAKEYRHVESNVV